MLMADIISNGLISGVASLSMKTPGVIGAREDAATAVEKFIRSASLLQSGAFLGWQVSPDGRSGCSVLAFRSADAPVTGEDFAWIFRNCADVAPSSGENSLEPQGGCRVYALKPSGAERSSYPPPDRCRSGRDEYCAELLDTMLGAGAVIRIAAGQGAGGSIAAGTIAFSMQGELTLRMRPASLVNAILAIGAKFLFGLKKYKIIIDEFIK